MNIEDVEVGQKVRLTIDRARYTDPLDLAYLLRQTPHSEGLEPLDGSELVVFDLIPMDGWTGVGLKRTMEGPKEYLAYPVEIEPVKTWGEPHGGLVAPDVEPKGPRVRVGIVNDFLTYSDLTVEEEREEILEELRKRYNGNVDAVLAWGAERPDFEDMPEVDLLVIDYGALWQSSGLVADFSRRVRAWADEHSGKLVVLWTSFTCSIYHHEFEAEFIGHSFVPGDGEYCKHGDGNDYEYCGRHRSESVHTDNPGAPAGNVLARYAKTNQYAMERQVEEFWPKLRAWLGSEEGSR